MTTKSAQCLTTRERAAAISIIHGMGPQKYPRNFRRGLTFFSSSALGPYSSSRLAASSSVRPARLVASRSKSSSRLIFSAASLLMGLRFTGRSPFPALSKA